MLRKEEVFRSGDVDKIWQKFCGFLDLSLDEFMDMQRGLLSEQLALVAGSPLAKSIMNGHVACGVEDFRQHVPLTSYWKDYALFLGECDDGGLAAKSAMWAHTSGRGGQFKWAPYTERALDRLSDAAMADMILATSRRKGEVRVREGSRLLVVLAPRPYISGIISWLLVERFGVKLIPHPGEAENLAFQDRVEAGFRTALMGGVDLIGAVATVLLKMGEGFAEQPRPIRFSPSLLHPLILYRLARAYVRSKLEKRAILPKDLWPNKGVACGGTDAAVFREKLEYYWGRPPHEMYGATEAGIMAMQNLDAKGMNLYPFAAFFEFIPEEEWTKARQQEDYEPHTVLLDEVGLGKVYEIVITSFHGMPFLRYRLGDLVKVVELPAKGSRRMPPLFSFHSRADGLIDLYSVVRLDEVTVWQAIVATGVACEDWTARKEYERDWPILHFYIEPKHEVSAREWETLLHEQLKLADPFYAEAVGEIESNPVKVTLLPKGTFQSYYEKMQRSGADLAHLKPPHMNASDLVVQELLSLRSLLQKAV